MYRFKKMISLILIACFAISMILVPYPVNAGTSAQAETGYTVSGYIGPDFNYSNSSLRAGFKVELVNTGLFSTSDSDGYFQINSVPLNSSSYSLKITKTNYLLRQIDSIVVTGNIQVGKPDNPVKMWAGDIARGGKQDDSINMTDVMSIATYFNSAKGDGRYTPDADLNEDNAINMTDIIIIAGNFNRIPANYPEVVYTYTPSQPSSTSAIINTPTIAPTNTPTKTSTPTFPATPTPTKTPTTFAATPAPAADFTIVNGELTKYNGNGGNVVIPNDLGITSIGVNAFSGCTNLTSVTIPNSVTSISGHSFYGCSKLSAINVDAANANYSSLNGILFNKTQTIVFECPEGISAASYNIPNTVTRIDDCSFSRCASLTSITIPNSVTSIGDLAFFGCSKLSAINVDAANANYSSLNGVLFNKTQTIVLKYPEGISATSYNIPNTVTHIYDYSFAKCANLTGITIPNSVTSIGILAFDGTSLTSVSIPNSVTSIGNSAFLYCIDLTSITIPNSVTSIGEGAFTYCNNVCLYVYPGSYAEKYAISHSIKLVAQDSLSQGLIAHYEFEGNVKDSSENTNDGTNNGGVEYVDGVMGTSARFDGMDDFCEIKNSTILNPASLTLSAWIKPNALSGVMPIISKYNSSVSNGTSWALESFEDGKVSFSVYESYWKYGNNNAYKEVQTTNSVLKSNQWQHIVGSFDFGTQKLKIFVDGKENPTINSTANAQKDIIIQNSTTPVYIGTYINRDGVYNGFWNGQIDDARIYSRTLSDSEVQQLYQIGETGSTEWDTLYNLAKEIGAECSPYGVITVKDPYGNTIYQKSYNVDQVDSYGNVICKVAADGNMIANTNYFMNDYKNNVVDVVVALSTLRLRDSINYTDGDTNRAIWNFIDSYGKYDEYCAAPEENKVKLRNTWLKQALNDKEWTPVKIAVAELNALKLGFTLPEVSTTNPNLHPEGFNEGLWNFIYMYGFYDKYNDTAASDKYAFVYRLISMASKGTLNVPILEMGQDSSGICYLQEQLTNKLGLDTQGVDNHFGRYAESAVKAVQKYKGLPESGKVDKQTWAAINELVRAANIEEIKTTLQKYQLEFMPRINTLTTSDTTILYCKTSEKGGYFYVYDNSDPVNQYKIIEKKRYGWTTIPPQFTKGQELLLYKESRYQIVSTAEAGSLLSDEWCPDPLSAKKGMMTGVKEVPAEVSKGISKLLFVGEDNFYQHTIIKDGKIYADLDTFSVRFNWKVGSCYFNEVDTFSVPAEDNNNGDHIFYFNIKTGQMLDETRAGKKIVDSIDFFTEDDSVNNTCMLYVDAVAYAQYLGYCAIEKFGTVIIDTEIPYDSMGTAFMNGVVRGAYDDLQDNIKLITDPSQWDEALMALMPGSQIVQMISLIQSSPEIAKACVEFYWLDGDKKAEAVGKVVGAMLMEALISKGVALACEPIITAAKTGSLASIIKKYLTGSINTKTAVSVADDILKVEKALSNSGEDVFENVKSVTKNGDELKVVFMSSDEEFTMSRSELKSNLINDEGMDPDKAEYALKRYENECFTGDTLVTTKAGLKRIDKIKEGDFVLAKDVNTGTIDYKQVKQVYIKGTYELLHLRLEGEEIRTTLSHLFFTDSGWWKAAGNLKPGDRILNSKGELKTLMATDVETLAKPEKIFNINVDGFHTYFVGQSGLLVHNNCLPEQIAARGESIENARTRGITDSKELSIIGSDAADYVLKSIMKAFDELISLPQFKLMKKSTIEEMLINRGYTSVPAIIGEGNVWTKALPDGNTMIVRTDNAMVRLQPNGWADEKPHVHKEILPSYKVVNGNYDPFDEEVKALIKKYSDSCELSTENELIHTEMIWD